VRWREIEGVRMRKRERGAEIVGERDKEDGVERE